MSGSALTVELTARFNRVLVVLFAVHVAMFFFCQTWAGLLNNIAATMFITLGMLAAARQRTCVLAMWGFIMGVWVLLLTFVAIAGLPGVTNLVIENIRTSTSPALAITGLCLASMFVMIYYAVSLSAVILAFRLRCALLCNKCCETKYEAVEMGEAETETTAAPTAASQEDTTQFFAVPTVGAPVPYAVPAEYLNNLSGQPMYVMVPLAPVAQQ